jgi:uncharacterized membrane protein (DUF2068 family)
MDWSLLGCGAGGHVTFAPDEPGLRDRFGHAAREGQAWRCLRCGTFVIGEPAASGPAQSAPRVRRAEQVRSALILRIFAVERFIRAVIFGALAIAVWRFSVSRLSFEQSYDQALPPLKALLRDLGFSVDHSKLLGLIHEAFTVDSAKLGYIAIGLGAYAVIEVIEGVGLWLVKRWGEYFAMIVTSLGLPYEIYDLTNKVTVLRVVAFLINLGLVLYLVLTKRLFGVRGGKKAYEAMLRSESILDAEIAALAAERQGESEQQAEPGRHAKPAPPGAPGPATEPVPAGEPPWSAPAPPTGAPGPATEPVPAGEPGMSAAAAPAAAPGPATEPVPAGEPGMSAAAAPADEAPADPPAPAASEAPDADEADVTALPPLPRRHPPS